MTSSAKPFIEKSITMTPVENQKRICAHEVLPIEVAVFDYMNKPVEVKSSGIAFSDTIIGKEIIAWHLAIREKMFRAI
jgi:hypothetical protein